LEKRKYVLDTSAIIGRQIGSKLQNNEIKGGDEIIVPIPVIDELRSQASDNREQGIIGLDEIRKIREFCGTTGVVLSFRGHMPTFNDIQLAKGGRIDAIITDIARERSPSL
jgi:ATPase